MNIDPLIIVHNSKHVSLQKAVSSIEKFTSIACDDNPASILSKQLRLSKPSEDVSEKLKVLVASIKEEMDPYMAAMKDSTKSNNPKSNGENIHPCLSPIFVSIGGNNPCFVL